MSAQRKKVCRDCGAEKFLRHFYHAAHNADRHEGICKVCKRLRTAEYQERRRRYYLEKKRERSHTPEARAKREAYRKSARGRALARACHARSYRRRPWRLLARKPWRVYEGAAACG